MQLFNITKAVVYVPSLHIKVPPEGTIEISEEAYADVKELIKGILSTSKLTDGCLLRTQLPSTASFDMLKGGTEGWIPDNGLTLEQVFLFHRVARRAFFRRMG